ncbi:tRNA epoxyqueuosine(34) reductase QueG [Porphyromonadaceae bacterium OttesenSCG-928-L07]|nr:tRNA epoxyqueuosine(34) reductase QueG [Porphyromonadaceae bacterium OttesenSCG-928-L07]
MNDFFPIKEKALNLGFDAIGVTTVDRLVRERLRLERWLEEGCHAGLGYMERNIEKRENPALLVENARSVIVTLTNYYTTSEQLPGAPLISRYAYGKDYHVVIKDKLKALMEGMDGRCFVDTAPVFEDEWARRAGLGWIGKNTLLINPQLGSFCFIGVIITSLEFDEYNTAIEENYCNHCTRCIDACPTGALQPFRLDASKCISYNTNSNKEGCPEDVKQKAGGRIFGCDICQDVCPWNQKLNEHRIPDFVLKPEIANLTQKDWLMMSDATFKILFKDTPLGPKGLTWFLRNLPLKPLVP